MENETYLDCLGNPVRLLTLEDGSITVVYAGKEIFHTKMLMHLDDPELSRSLARTLVRRLIDAKLPMTLLEGEIVY